MATYNGGKHLRDQIDSILAQSDQDWTLYVHDDGSTDDTMELLQEYATRHDKVKLLDYASAGGACANFLSILEKVEADYYFYADQDDIWLEDKIKLTRAEMLKQEQERPGLPVVVHTDLYVVDERLDIINKSFMVYAGIHPEFLTTFDECVIPFVTGCTMMFNAEAKKATCISESYAFMHDCWIALNCISKQGAIIFIPHPLVLYRQHGTNTVGARDIKKVTLGYRMNHILSILRHNKDYYRMLHRLGYGSVFKYIKYKIKYHHRVHQNKE